MNRPNGRVTTLWVALAAVVIAAMLHWQKNLPSSDVNTPTRQDTLAVSHPGFGQANSPASSIQQSPFVPPPTNKPTLFGARGARYPLPFSTMPRRAPKPAKRPNAPMRAAVGDTIAVSLTQYCLRSLTRRDHETREGIVAADPRVFPLGREVDLFMDGQLLGRYLIDDTGLLIKGRILDVWVPDCRAARRFGRQKGKAVLVAKDS